MKKTGIVFIALWALLSTFQATAKEASLTDDTIAQRLIDNSIAAYSGNCPCPYNAARNGSRCGKRSAYNRPGGAAPLCFKEDVTKAMVQEYRARMKG
jgi:hypothetical protein